MLVVKINSNGISKSDEEIRIKSKKVIRKNEKSAYVEINTYSNISLNINDKIAITNDNGDKKELNIKNISQDKKTFYLEIPTYNNITFKSYYKNSNSETYFILDYPLPKSFKKNELINLKFIDNKQNSKLIDFKVVDSFCVMHNGNANDIINKVENDSIFIRDNRFYVSDNKLDIKTIDLSRLNILFNIPFNEDISLNLNMEDNIKNIYKSKTEDIIPEIIDFEKKQFIPCHINENGDAVEVENIKINLFFRDRSKTTLSNDIKKSKRKLSENWITDDTRGWNQRSLEEDTIKKDEIKDGDLIGYLGFTDDDVYYQKSKLLKSFIRLSYFDSKEIGSQMLLNYSTIFMDTGKMYENYLNFINLKNDPSMIGSEIIKEMDDQSFPANVTADERICSSFSIFSDNNKNKSSEGFYIYLYDTVLNGRKDKDGFSDIYVKIEFNHAKYGRTVPFIIPYGNDGMPLHFYSPNFPTSYMEKNDKGNMVIDMERFNNDTFMNIKCKFDKKSKKYIYTIPNAEYDEKENSITINAFEPRINDLI